MAILASDIKLNASKVMLDTPEGGGGPTSHVILDGHSNEIYPDISEMDRTNGRVNLRQLHVTVQTDNRDILLGVNVIVAEPPDDPNVSITIFSTGESFDTRIDAVSRLESYLSQGPSYAGYLFGNHIEGMASLSIFQKGAIVPSINDTLVLTKREGFSDEFSQYVRVTSVAVTVQEFEDASGAFSRNVVVMTLSDVLRADFPGFDIYRYEYTTSQIAAKTKISTTIVANAARYYGVVPLAVAADMTDFSVQAESIFTQLVPSAQVETPIADARVNQVGVAVVAAGEPLTQNFISIFTDTQNLFVGGAIVPGTLSLVRGSITLTEEGGRLFNGSDQVGLVDYANGVLTLLTNVFGGGSGTHVVTYTPGATATAPSQSQGFEITINNRALNFVRTIEPVPVEGTLQLDYMVNGSWYVLRDDGSGAIRGDDSSFGVGMLNRTTGTITVTLGALPDVDSSILISWVVPASEKDNSILELENDGTMFMPVNTDGDLSLLDGSKAIEPGNLTITWNDGSARTASDDGEGGLTGYASGKVKYSEGLILFSPTTLPAPGTQINFALSSSARLSDTASLVDAGSVMAFDLDATDIQPGSVWITLTVPLMFVYTGEGNRLWRNVTVALADLRGDGNLYMVDREGSLLVGDIDYASGTGTLIKNVSVPDNNAKGLVGFDNIYQRIFVPEPIGIRVGAV